MREDWLPDLKSRGVSEIAASLGLSSPRPRTLSPCPSCHAEVRGSRDPRGPIGVRRDDRGWECHRCKEKGDALTLAAWVVCGTAKPQREQWGEVKERFFGREALCLRPRPRASAPRPFPSPLRPPAGELDELWASCHPVEEDPALAALLRERAIDPGLVSERDLARALPPGLVVPRWAFGPGGAWSQSDRRLLVPLFDARGQLQSLHARDIRPDARPPKGLSPARYEVSGLVFAEELARQVLEAGAFPEWWIPRREERLLIIAEGVPDFLTWATRYAGDSDAYLSSPPILGIIAGSWTSELAARIPADCNVIIRAHQDAAGEKYTDLLVRTLNTKDRYARGYRVFCLRGKP